MPVRDHDEREERLNNEADARETEENDKLRMCFVEKKDWRLCKNEVRGSRSRAVGPCWQRSPAGFMVILTTLTSGIGGFADGDV